MKTGFYNLPVLYGNTKLVGIGGQYRGTLLFFGGTGTFVLFFSWDFRNVSKNLKRCKNACE